DKIDQLKLQIKPGNDKESLLIKYSVYNQLFEEYKSFIFDSAFYYSRQLLSTARQLNALSKVNEAKVQISFTLLSAGMFKEALDTLNSINPELLSGASRIEYYYDLARTYYDMADYSNDSYFSDRYNERGNKYLHQALALCDSGSVRYYLLKGLDYMRIRDLVQSIKTFERVLEMDITEHERAIASSSLSYMYRLDGKPEKAKEFLAKAALADIKTSTKETVAIRDLAEVLYNEGQIDRSYKYIKIALEDAYFYGAKHRKIQIANILPFIEGTQMEKLEGQRRDLIYYSISATLLFVLIVGFAFIIVRQNRKLAQAKQRLSISHDALKQTNNQLAEANNELEAINSVLAETNAQLEVVNSKLSDANKIKEEYIGSFFKIISEYIEKIEKFKMTIDRKMSQKKLEDVRDIINNMNLKSEREHLYLTFDSIFLKIFPGFVEQFNELFKPEDRFVIDEKQGLPTELRIFALIRLGITDNEKIAKVLDYSVNTIYTYKTRVKNKSIVSNEKFEEELMAIKVL
ncbi:MAG TPA: DUF6377 domain-containing protein, partial [Cytophagaceae bacterium]